MVDEVKQSLNEKEPFINMKVKQSTYLKLRELQYKLSEASDFVKKPSYSNTIDTVINYYKNN